MGKAKKIAIGAGVVLVLVAGIALWLSMSIPGCSTTLGDLKGNLVGNAFEISTYDDYGQLTSRMSGKRVSLTGNKVKTSGYSEAGNAVETWELSSVITVTIDGREMETCGNTCLFVEKGLEPDLDFSSPEFIESHGGSPLSITSLSYLINQYKNYFGKNRVVVIKSQLGQPICAFSGNNVYWEVRTDLPKTTKLMVDGKALYIHRANFQIIDKKLLEE